MPFNSNNSGSNNSSDTNNTGNNPGNNNAPGYNHDVGRDDHVGIFGMGIHSNSGASAISWGFYIVGYQPAQKWLKDRKGRALSFEDVKHYQRILKILSETNRIMQTITMTLEAAEAAP